jgi:hypothetical protein
MFFMPVLWLCISGMMFVQFASQSVDPLHILVALRVLKGAACSRLSLKRVICVGGSGN